jgi:hypothetical protein
MPDTSPWAFTPSIGFAAKMVTINMVVFWGVVLFLFWVCQRGQQPVMNESPEQEKESVFLPTPSHEG